MELAGKKQGLDEKLDGLLSLLMHEFGDTSTVPLSVFNDRYAEFFGEELEDLQQILSQDGLVRFIVSPEGLLGTQITDVGLQFMARGGYSREIREEMISHEDAVRVQQNLKVWNWVVGAGFVFALGFCYYLRHHIS